MAKELRTPAVAGRFYPGEASELERDVEQYLRRARRSPRPHLAVMAPHAGYVYSGGVAGVVFADTEVPRRVIVLAPNHTGRGRPGAVWPDGAFVVPGGQIPVDAELCEKLLAGKLVADREAHRFEHALEVELPFLRARRADFVLTPVILAGGLGGLGLDDCVEIGAQLARAVASLDEPVLLVASSDMNHYLDDATTRRVDARALEALGTLDPAALHRRVTDEDITMCGILPATAMLSYARERGATRAVELAYATSAEASGDTSRVVGYAGVAIDA